jgi:hypothetical protein
MTTKLIQELVGLVIEKDLDYQYIKNWGELFVGSQNTPVYFEINLRSQDAPVKLQAAIEMVRGLK